MKLNTTTNTIPHPIPYQGSKRKLAASILELMGEKKIHTLYEPFSGSAAVTLAAAKMGKANTYYISDSLVPLAGIWKLIIKKPNQLIERYSEIWNENAREELEYYNDIRDKFNTDGDPAKLLYLLARCVKNAVRFNAEGMFNQSQDKRRLGTHPSKMSKSILHASQILHGSTVVSAGDYSDILDSATSCDLIYMDPPYQGTSTGKDSRYHQNLDRASFYDYLEFLNSKNIPFLLSFDGRCGDKVYGDPLPKELKLGLVELEAGRSSQATLSGRDDITIESLYLSPAMRKRIKTPRHKHAVSA